MISALPICSLSYAGSWRLTTHAQPLQATGYPRPRLLARTYRSTMLTRLSFDRDSSSATTRSSTSTDSTSQTGVVIAATVGSLIFICVIVVLFYLYRALRRIRDTRKEEEKRQRARRHKKMYIQPVLYPTSGEDSSSGCGTTVRDRTWSDTPAVAASQAVYDGDFDYPYPSEVDYRYAETNIGVRYSTQFSVALPAAQTSPRNLSSDAGGQSSTVVRLDHRGYNAYYPVTAHAPGLLVPPVSLRTSCEYPGLGTVQPLDETNPQNYYRRYSTDEVSPLGNEETVTPEGYFAGIPARLDAAVHSDHPGMPHGERSVTGGQTVNRPVCYQGGQVTPVWDDDGVLEEFYVEDWTRMGK